MPQIGTLLTGAGVTTVISGQPQCEEFLLLGDVDTANPLQGLQVEIDGTTYINIANAATLLTAYAKWLSQFTATIVGIVFKLATGNIPKPTTYRLTNAGATTPAVFAWSDNNAGVPFVVTPVTVVATNYQDFERFSALFIQTPANLDRAEVVFASGRKQTLVGVELDAMFSMKYSTEANGQLGGVTVIDNTDQSIDQVRIYTNAGAGGTAVLVAKVPDVAFAALRGK
jgi:hypothetical protein